MSAKTDAQPYLRYDLVRSSRQGDDLPINDNTDVDPLFKHKAHKLKYFKLPYSQAVQPLVEECNLKKDNIEPPHFLNIINKNDLKIDLSLTNVIDKKKDPNVNLQIVNKHINNIYHDSWQVYTDGSKDPEQCLAGAGLIIFSEDKTPLTQGGFKFDFRLSIYSCELVAIAFALNWLLEQAKSNNKHSKVTILSDSLSALMSLKSGFSKSRPEILQQILNNTTLLAKLGVSITFVWIPSHIGIKGNEIADSIAKQASKQGSEINIKLSVQEAYSWIKTNKNQVQ